MRTLVNYERRKQHEKKRQNWYKDDEYWTVLLCNLILLLIVYWYWFIIFFLIWLNVIYDLYLIYCLKFVLWGFAFIANCEGLSLDIFDVIPFDCILHLISYNCISKMTSSLFSSKTMPSFNILLLASSCDTHGVSLWNRTQLLIFAYVLGFRYL